MSHSRAFTLIELLIVVAIIAILAAIAVPNFLEAQTRAKVSRVKADLRSIATAVESYHIDWNIYPLDEGAVFGTEYRLDVITDLSTPVAYITSVAVEDPFNTTGGGLAGGMVTSYQYFNFQATGATSGRAVNWGDVVSTYDPEVNMRGCALKSWGPIADNDGLEWIIFGIDEFHPTGDPNGRVGISRLYDPTNGTVSAGDVGRFAGDVPGIPQQP